MNAYGDLVTVNGFTVQRFRGSGVTSNPPAVLRVGLNR